MTNSNSTTYNGPYLNLNGLWKHEGKTFALWDSDSKRIISSVFPGLRLHVKKNSTATCMHLQGRGGVKGAVRWIYRRMGDFKFVARFDVASYYNSMRHKNFFSLPAIKSLEPSISHIVKEYLDLPDIRSTGKGIVAGGSISTLLGAIYLSPLDKIMHRLTRNAKTFYIRYMDDIIIMAKTRWCLRDAVRKMFQVTNSLGLKMHKKEKFFIGRIEKGFSFSGYQFHPGRKLCPSAESLRRFATNARRLYEQQGDLHRLGLYVSRWTLWLWSGLPGMVSTKGGNDKYLV